MSIATECAFHITLKAADRVHDLGLWPPFKVMLEHIHETLPDLRSLHVDLGYAYGEDHPSVIIYAYTDKPTLDPHEKPAESNEWRWDRWAVNTFPSEVIEHFCLITIPWREPSER